MYINIDGYNYNIKVIRKDNKNTYIRVINGEIVITTNYFESDKKLLKLVNDNIISIKRMIDRDKKKMDKNSKFYYLGNEYDVIVGSFSNVDIIGNKIYAPSYIVLDKWIKKNIVSIFTSRLDYWYNLFEENIKKPKLRLRKMKTRWGVCNVRTICITLNTELIKYSYDCIDYVIVHELSHLVYANHSKSFWELVCKYCPNYKEIRNKLKD